MFVLGHTPTGCPSYASAARVLQEAIMSTPRQHMMLQFTERKWLVSILSVYQASFLNFPIFQRISLLKQPLDPSRVIFPLISGTGRISV